MAQEWSEWVEHDDDDDCDDHLFCYVKGKHTPISLKRGTDKNYKGNDQTLEILSIVSYLRLGLGCKVTMQ